MKPSTFAFNKPIKLWNLQNLSEYEIIKIYETNETIKPLKPFNSFTFNFSRDEQQLTCGVINLSDAWYFWPPDSRARIYVFKKRSVLDIDCIQKKLIKKNDQLLVAQIVAK